MEKIIEFVLTHGIEIIASGVVIGFTFVAGHIQGYIKRKADEPQQDIYDVVQAVIDDIEARENDDSSD